MRLNARRLHQWPKRSKVLDLLTDGYSLTTKVCMPLVLRVWVILRAGLSKITTVRPRCAAELVERRWKYYNTSVLNLEVASHNCTLMNFWAAQVKDSCSVMAARMCTRRTCTLVAPTGVKPTWASGNLEASRIDSEDYHPEHLSGTQEREVFIVKRNIGGVSLRQTVLTYAII